MEETKDSILQSVRAAVGLDKEDDSFDFELIIHINNAIATMVQNGVGKPLHITGVDEEWKDFKDPNQVLADLEMFQSVKAYVFLKTKILFDPPPPSTIKYMDEAANEVLWRLRESYDLPINKGVVE